MCVWAGIPIHNLQQFRSVAYHFLFSNQLDTENISKDATPKLRRVLVHNIAKIFHSQREWYTETLAGISKSKIFLNLARFHGNSYYSIIRITIAGRNIYKSWDICSLACCKRFATTAAPACFTICIILLAFFPFFMSFRGLFVCGRFYFVDSYRFCCSLSLLNRSLVERNHRQASLSLVLLRWKQKTKNLNRFRCAYWK